MTSPKTHDVTQHLECMTSCITSRYRKYTGAGNFGTGAGTKIEGEEAKKIAHTAAQAPKVDPTQPLGPR